MIGQSERIWPFSRPDVPVRTNLDFFLGLLANPNKFFHCKPMPDGIRTFFWNFVRTYKPDFQKFSTGLVTYIQGSSSGTFQILMSYPTNFCINRMWQYYLPSDPLVYHTAGLARNTHSSTLIFFPRSPTWTVLALVPAAGWRTENQPSTVSPLWKLLSAMYTEPIITFSSIYLPSPHGDFQHFERS